MSNGVLLYSIPFCCELGFHFGLNHFWLNVGSYNNLTICFFICSYYLILMILFASKAETTFSCKLDLSFILLLIPTCSCQIRSETRYEFSDIWIGSGLLKSSNKIRWLNSKHLFLVFRCYYLFFIVLWKCCNVSEFFVALTVVCSLSSVLSVVP